MKFGKLILRKISTIFATRCLILGLKCTKNRFRLGLRSRPRWGSLQCSPMPLAGFGSPTSKGRGGKGKRGEGSGGEGRGGKGRGGKGKEGGKGKGRTTAILNFFRPCKVSFRIRATSLRQLSYFSLYLLNDVFNVVGYTERKTSKPCFARNCCENYHTSRLSELQRPSRTLPPRRRTSTCNQLIRL